MSYLRLGINIDHVATLRNARGDIHPDPVRAAQMAEEAGADGITVHLREDRRHIRDTDVKKLRHAVSLPLNLEMAATEEMVNIALSVQPHACCIVPERRQELTTEGGLDVMGQHHILLPFITRLKGQGIRVSLFISPDMDQLRAARQAGADAVELHTGTYAKHTGILQQKELQHLKKAATFIHQSGLECHAGHGLDYDNVGPIAAIPEVTELNIGHFLMGEALFIGLKESIRQMRHYMDKAR